MGKGTRQSVQTDSQAWRNTDYAGDTGGRFYCVSPCVSPSAGDLIVTPKEVDSIIDEVSKIIAESINEAVNGKAAQKLGEIL